MCIYTVSLKYFWAAHRPEDASLTPTAEMSSTHRRKKPALASSMPEEDFSFEEAHGLGPLLPVQCYIGVAILEEEKPRKRPKRVRKPNRNKRCIAIGCLKSAQGGWCQGYCIQCAQKNGCNRPVELRKQKKKKKKDKMKQEPKRKRAMCIVSGCLKVGKHGWCQGYCIQCARGLVSMLDAQKLQVKNTKKDKMSPPFEDEKEPEVLLKMKMKAQRKVKKEPKEKKPAQHAMENGCQPPVHRSGHHNDLMCKKCQEIVHKEQEAAGRGFSDLIPTKGQYRLRARWANGMCWKHARLAGYSSKETLFSNVGMMEKGHRQKKLPFITVLEKKKSQSQMALNEETSSEGSTELPLQNPSEAIPPMDVQSISEIDTVLDVHSLCEASDIGIMEDVSTSFDRCSEEEEEVSVSDGIERRNIV